MDIFTLDFESTYDDAYSLSKIQTDAYVLSPLFEVIGLGVKHNGGPEHWFTDGKVEKALDLIPWDNAAILCHNTLFDGFILSQRFHRRPKLWLDTLGMARALYPWLPSHSLAALAQYLGLGVKGTEVLDAKGKRRADFTPEQLAAYGRYCCNDCAITYKIYQVLAPRFPLLEHYLLDLHIRMFTEPGFVLDEPKLTTYRDRLIAEKAALLDAYNKPTDPVEIAKEALSGVDRMKLNRETVMSNPKFAEALQALGVDPPRKVSKTTGKSTWAFAKTDKALTDLQEHPDSAVQALVAARLGVKTTIAETRAQTLIETAQRGVGFPIYLNFWGARTTGRASGGNKINALNMPNRGKDRVIRESMLAPPGYRVVVGDSSNIELRTNLVMSGQVDLVQKIKDYDAQGAAAVSDLYCDFASTLFGATVRKNDKMERTVGKISELSLGYSAAAVTFQNMLRVQSGGQIVYPLDECERIVGLYRRGHDMVVKFWYYLNDRILPCIAAGNAMQSVDVNGWLLTTNEGFGLPGHVGVVYHDLRRNAEGDWEYQQGRGRVKIYGGKCSENACLGADTQVLTDRGWVQITQVQDGDLVHDGIEFVKHGGMAYTGCKQCVEVDGVLMTPDHRVLTNEGWKLALEKPRPHRPDLRHVDCALYEPQRWEEDALGIPMHLRNEVCEGGCRCDEGSETRRDAELWVQNQRADERKRSYTRHVAASSIRRMAQHVRPLPATHASGVEKLRRAWDNGTQALAGIVREFLERHGGYVPARTYFGAQGERQGIQCKQLYLGDAQTASAKQTGKPGGRFVGTGAEVRNQAFDAGIPICAGVARRRAGTSGGREEIQGGEAQPVYDVTNCGPRSRYVVRGLAGPFIVHNSQHVARHIVMWQMARFARRYPVKLEAYDEVVSIVREAEAPACAAFLLECLRTAPPWTQGLIPLNGEVGIGENYSDAKP